MAPSTRQDEFVMRTNIPDAVSVAFSLSAQNNLEGPTYSVPTRKTRVVLSPFRQSDEKTVITD